MRFILQQGGDGVPVTYIGQACEIIYFSDDYTCCEVMFLDGTYWHVTLSNLSQQGVD